MKRATNIQLVTVVNTVGDISVSAALIRNTVGDISISAALIIIFLVFSTDILQAQQSNRQRFDNVQQRSIISDYKAIGVGDAVQILIVEMTEAGNSAGATESRNSSLSGGFGFGIENRNPQSNTNSTAANANLNSRNDFKGSGSNTRRESIRSRLTAKVVGEDERGNLIIEGTRRTKVDGEDQTFTLRGVIRGADIRADNSVFSYNIMDLELSVEGQGNASKMRQPGLFTKFFRLLF